MTALEVAADMGLTIKQFEDYTKTCTDIVETENLVAVLKGNQVHLAARIKGLSGRRMLSECQRILARWFALEPVLVAPIKHGNIKAIRVAEALGFRWYAETSGHAWLSLARENFHVS